MQRDDRPNQDAMTAQRKKFHSVDRRKLWQPRRIAPLSGHVAMRRSGTGKPDFHVYHVVYESSQLDQKGWTASKTVITMRRKNNTQSTFAKRCQEWGQRVFCDISRGPARVRRV